MKYKARVNIREFLLTFFADESEEIKEKHFEREKEINGFILVKYFDRTTANGFWNVMIFTKESRAKMLDAREKYQKQGLLMKEIISN